MRHLVEDGKLTQAEAAALIAQAQTLLQQQPRQI